MKHSDKLILVTGATGKQGGSVARHLVSDGWRVRALTRNPDKPEAHALRGRGAEIVKGDLSDRLSVDKVLNGVYGVFSVQNSWEHGVEKEVVQGVLLADAAKTAGVKHFVYTSVGSAHRNTGIPHFESKWKIEQHIRSLRLAHTILRPVFFMENFYMPDTQKALYEGTFSLGTRPDQPLQIVAVDDIGVFAAMAFDRPGDFVGREIDLAGDELTGPQMAERMGQAIGRSVSFVQTPIEAIRGFSEDYALMVEWFNAKGYEADIKHLREEHPGLENLDTWLVRAAWKKAEAVHA
ncbi:MAG: NmrA/HSCARG family protein [Chitinispirillaceae bacterium]|nr:NmrA/HSCARG family protein [Chitinispirillaceae bacterium]